MLFIRVEFEMDRWCAEMVPARQSHSHKARTPLVAPYRSSRPISKCLAFTSVRHGKTAHGTRSFNVR